MSLIKKIFSNDKIDKIILSIFCLIFLVLILQNTCQYNVLNKDTFKISHYDSLSNDKSISNPFSKNLDYVIPAEADKKINISFDFKISHINQWDNLFQTADLNNGIRMELDKDANAFVAFRCAKDGDLIGIDLGKLELNKWYNFNLIKIPNSNIVVYLNNESHVYSQKKIIFDVNNLVVGQGFDSTRRFNGEIKNFKLKYYAVSQNSVLQKILKVVFYCLLLFLAVCISIKVIYNLKRSSEKFSYNNLLFIILLNLYPLLFCYLTNIYELEFLDFAKFLSISTIIFSCIYVLISSFASNNKSYIATSILILGYYFCGHIYNCFNYFVPILPNLFLKIAILLLAFMLFINFVVKNNFEIFTKVIRFITVVLLVLLLFNNVNKIYNVVLKNLKTASHNIKKYFLSDKNNKKIANYKSGPDVYFIILDAYVNNNQAKKYLEFNNDAFENNLKSKGFYIAENSTSNYPFTIFSVVSMLNFDYLDNLGFKNGDKDSILVNKTVNSYENNKLIKIFKAYGYNNYCVNRHYAISKNFSSRYVSDIGKIAKNYNTLANLINENSIMFVYKTPFDLHKLKIFEGFETLNSIIADENTKNNKFVFFHVVSPHWPYVLNKNISTNYDHTYDRCVADDCELNISAYHEQLLQINKLTIATINSILKYKKNSVIIILSDHGPSSVFYNRVNGNNDKPYFNLTKDFGLRAHNFEAIYYPDKDYKDLYPNVTPVNLVRITLNKYFDAKLPLLKDRYIFTHTFQEYMPNDITKNLSENNM